jgi:ribosome-binding factor A
LQGLLREELRALLRDDVSDPTLVEVRVTAVVLSVDYRYARVHFAITKAKEEARDDASRERARADHALVKATPFLRARLAEAIEMKRIPDLRFVFDGVLTSADD